MSTDFLASVTRIVCPFEVGSAESSGGGVVADLVREIEDGNSDLGRTDEASRDNAL